MPEYKKLKYYFDRELAQLLAEKIVEVFVDFNSKVFVRNIDKSVDDLELKDRVAVIAQGLRTHLPQDYPQALAILLKIIGPENPKETGMFTEGYWLMPVAYFVETYGIDDFDLSMNAIYEITKRNTGEYAIRPFVVKNLHHALVFIKKWAKDKNFQVRRLASEGIRPRLPWARKLDAFIKDPKPVLEILETLKKDPSPFVRKSVANNLNDILRDNYEIGMQTIRVWHQTATKETQWIIKHALRNEIKKGNPEAQHLVL